MTYLQDTITQIDKVLGNGFAKAHPELLGFCLISKAITEIDKTLVEAIENIIEISHRL